MTVNTFQVSLMSHSCVSNLEVVNPPSRSISFRVKRPVRTISLFLVSCFFTSWSTNSTAKPRYQIHSKQSGRWGRWVWKLYSSNFSQKSHQVLLWIGIHLVQQPSLVDRKSESATLLVLEKDESATAPIRKKWKCTNKLFRVHVTCMFSFRSAPGVAKKGNHCTLPGTLSSISASALIA